MERLGFTDLHIVEEQAVADPDFSTVESPNPEEFSSFKMALDLAKEYDPDLIMATDPDADRIGVVVKDASGEYRNLTGNQIGVLLSNFLLEQMKESGNLPDNGVIIKTIVSTEMIREVANRLWCRGNGCTDRF